MDARGHNTGSWSVILLKVFQKIKRTTRIKGQERFLQALPYNHARADLEVGIFDVNIISIGC